MATSSKIIEEYADINIRYDPTKNKSRPVLTRYEKAKILGMRMEQLARNSPPYVDVKKLGLKSIQEIAEFELKERKLPFLIARCLPNGIKEYYKLEDLVF